MKYKFITFFLFLISCSQNYTNSELKKPFNSKGFAYIYNHQDFLDKIIKKALDENSLQVAHSILRPGSLIKIINIKTNEIIILDNKSNICFFDYTNNQIILKKKLNLPIKFNTAKFDFIDYKKIFICIDNRKIIFNKYLLG
mgnify:CR=1 FL=1